MELNGPNEAKLCFYITSAKRVAFSEEVNYIIIILIILPFQQQMTTFSVFCLNLYSVCRKFWADWL